LIEEMKVGDREYYFR